MLDTIETRRDIIATCLWLKSRGLVFGTWGNTSVRLGNGNILITPSKEEYETMKPEDLVVLSPDGRQISGTRIPTSERELHRRILAKRQDMGAIIHMHSPYAMAAAARNEGVPVISEEMCQMLGGAIPLSSRFVPSQNHAELGEVVAESVTSANAILIRNHGPVCFGRTLAETRICCLVTEKACQMYLALLASGGFCEITNEHAENGRSYFLNDYGKS